MKKVGITFFILCMLLCLGVSASAAGLLSPAISVLQEETAMIKTGVGTNSVSFDAEDFTELLGDEDFLAIEITSLPEVSDGVLKLGAVDVTPGQLISYEALAALRFIPAQEGAVATFQFKPYGDRYENSFVCTVCMLDALNFAPTAAATELDAKESIPVYATPDQLKEHMGKIMEILRPAQVRTSEEQELRTIALVSAPPCNGFKEVK